MTVGSASKSATGSPFFDMKNQRLSSSSTFEFCVVIGREWRWPFEWRVVNIAKRVSLMSSHSSSRCSVVSVVMIEIPSASFEARDGAVRTIEASAEMGPVRRARGLV